MTEVAHTTPRTRNAAQTRADILGAARSRFARHGYDGVGVREIAAAAGVDAALINRYFGSKDELFLEVLACSGGHEKLTDGCHSSFGERVAHMLINEPPNEAKLDMLLIMLLSAGSPKARDVLLRHHEKNFHQPFECWIGGEDSAVKARLLGSIILGFAVSRTLDEGRLLDPAVRDELYQRLSKVLQDCIDA